MPLDAVIGGLEQIELPVAVYVEEPGRPAVGRQRLGQPIFAQVNELELDGRGLAGV